MSHSENEGAEASPIVQDRILTVPNRITLLRFLSIPILGFYLYAGDEGRIVSLVLFCLIALTDVLDGFVARHFHQVSEVGKLFDPFVDKLFQLTTAVLLFLTARLPLWVPLFILVKEALMIVGGLFLLRRYRFVVSARWYGKAAAVLQAFGFALIILLVEPGQVATAGLILIVPILLSFASYVQYGRENLLPMIRGGRDGPTDPSGS